MNENFKTFLPCLRGESRLPGEGSKHSLCGTRAAAQRQRLKIRTTLAKNRARP